MSFKIIELHNNTLKVFEDGTIMVKRYNNDEFYEKKCDKTKNGYLQLELCHKYKRKIYYIHRLVAYAFLGLDIENPKSQVDHKDRDKSNNFVSNLHIVTNSQNMFNTNARGYCWNKRDKKWRARIMVNKKNIWLGSFDNEEDASKCYQDAKLIYHIIEHES
jgi:hypothetical protein